MPAPKNTFKAAIRENRFQLGLWVALASPYAAEVVAGSGYDWLLIVASMRRTTFHAGGAVSRRRRRRQSSDRPPAVGDAVMIKQILDAGVQTLLIPMVDNVEQARQLVRAVRYPPHGVRGVGAALGRATNFSRIGDYLENANDEICLLLQIESRAGLEAIDAIAALDGVDGLFVGPADLAADMGHLGNPGHPEVRTAIIEAFARIERAGKARGIMTLDPAQARDYRDLGADFMAIGTDVTLLVSATERLRREFLGESGPTRIESGY